jgi:hypothetical protein
VRARLQNYLKQARAEEARAVLKQSLTAALTSPAAEVPSCLIEEIIKFAPMAAKASTSHCEAGKWLLKHHDPDAAKSEYEAAIKEDANRQCGIEGLEKTRSRITADKRISVADVGNSFFDELLNVAWPWLVAALLIRGTLAFVRGYIWTPNRTSLTAPADQKTFATAVMQAAGAAGRDSRRPLKVMTATDAALPADTVGDVSKLLGLPGSVPLQAIVNLAVGPTLANRAEVSSALAGGWATAEVVHRRPGHRRVRARIAIALGGLDSKAQEAALALAVGAWLIAIENEQIGGRDKDSRMAYALFRAGAYLQSTGDTTSALAFYAAMPTIGICDEPLAWIGSRANTVTILGSARLQEVKKLMHDVDEGVHAYETNPREHAPILGLGLRAQYIATCLWVNAEHLSAAQLTDLDTVTIEEEAKRHTEKLKILLANKNCAGLLTPGEKVAMELTVLTHKLKITAGEQQANSREAIEKHRHTVVQDCASATQRSQSNTPPLTAAALYDAACVYSLLAGKAHEGSLEPLAAELCYVARAHLKAALEATEATQRPRFTATASADPTLAFIRGADAPPEPAASSSFNETIGKAPPAGPQEIDATLRYGGRV